MITEEDRISVASRCSVEHFEANQLAPQSLSFLFCKCVSPDEVEAKLPEIEDFTELGEFLSYPVRTYSAGMFIRLAFAVSTSINPEILLIDEVMGAGDLRFANKAKRRMFEFMEQGKILVFSSHNFDLLKSFCARTIWLEKGRIVMDGKTEDVIAKYESIQK